MDKIEFTPVINTIDDVKSRALDYYNQTGQLPESSYVQKALGLYDLNQSNAPITTSTSAPTQSTTKTDVFGNIIDEVNKRMKDRESALPQSNSVFKSDSTITTNSGETVNLSKGQTGNAKKAIDYLTTKEGFTKEQATAIAANLHIESGFNTAAIGDTNLGKGQEAVGIAQWRLGRKNNMLNFLKQKNLNPESFEGQLSFLAHELKTGQDGSGGKAWKAMQSTSDVKELARKFDQYYERSDGKAREKRANLAEKLYKS